MLVRTALMLIGFSVAACSSAPNRTEARDSKVESQPTGVNPDVQYGAGDTITLTEGPIDLNVVDRQASVGDTVVITDTLNSDELTLIKVIDIDGTILLPELGAVIVAGHTGTELESMLNKSFAPYFPKLDVHVELVHTGPDGRYFVYGEVASSGEVPFWGDLTILEAVMKAGPIEGTANLRHVQLMRADLREPQVFQLDLAAVRYGDDSSRNPRVNALDIIYVPPTLPVRVARWIAQFRAWLREWILHPPILIAGAYAR